ncbi:MAG TPA: DUF1579 domain-containing protein [Azonexus sp.]|nr:DUF1579 domain-containing protein [Azonexus sp.]
MKTELQKEHHWLQKMVGEWTYEGEATMEPGKPAEKFKGTERVQSLGGLWIQANGKGEMPDGETAMMVMTLGFNPQTKRYIGTWIGSMMTHLWLYDGELDAAEKVLTLNSEGPAMCTSGTMAKYRDVIEIVSGDHRTLSSYILGDDGEWRPFMRADYRRM